jgi:hypothetical protein
VKPNFLVKKNKKRKGLKKMSAIKSKKKVNPRPNKFGNFENFRCWALAMLKDVDLTKYGVRAR